MMPSRDRTDSSSASTAAIPGGRDIAIVIVSYRTAALAIESIRSVEAERSDPTLRVRAIVVDNASGDFVAIREAIERNNWASWVTAVLAPRNGGFAYGNNLGIQCAYSVAPPDYVYLLNPDAQIRPGAIGALAQFLEKHREAGIAGSGIENSDGSEWLVAFRFPTLLSELNEGLSLGLIARFMQRWVVARPMGNTPEPVDWICGASMMIRRAVVESIGGLDENYFLYFEETDFCYRAKQAGFSTWYVPESRVMHIRGQSTSVTEITSKPRRLPGYWFDSRRRYFAMTFGPVRAILIDVVALVAHSLGLLKRLALNRRETGVPHFVRDLLQHSVLLPRNRTLPPVRSFKPRG